MPAQQQLRCSDCPKPSGFRQPVWQALCIKGEMDILIGTLLGSFFVCVIFYMYQAMSILLWVSKQGCGLRLSASAAPGWAIKRYLSWCSDTGAVVNQDRIQKYRRGTKALAVGGIFLVAAFLLIAVGA